LSISAQEKEKKKTKKELKKEQEVRKVFFLLTASFDIARKLNYCCLVGL
jgi:hypothetical protein